MASPWDAWDDMPPLVDANGARAQPPRNIPPPPGATMPSGRPGPAPVRGAPPPPNMPQFPPWGMPFAQPAHQPDPWAPWRQYYDAAAAAAYPQKSAPSPYIPRQPLHPQMPSSHPHPQFATHIPHRPQTMPNPNPMPNTSKKPSSHHHHHAHQQQQQPKPSPWQQPKPSPWQQPKPSPWPSQGADLSPLDLPTRMPDVQMFTPRAPAMHTPSSSLSQSISSSSNIPPGVYHERPQQWRSDFKFKSGFASMFRGRSNATRSLDNLVDSAKLDLHPFLCYSKLRPMTIYDLRREPLTLVFRELGRPPFADDMDHSVTYPPTKYMRIYHSRLPWFIDISANGAPYISLADFFQQLFAAMSKQISKQDFYNNELDDEDREILTHAYLDRCRSEDERKEGVKQVDFLRGRVEWMGLSPGKNGMWRLKTT